jgi:glyoxylase-like metal-dependent hydrolase (beta-lactamase superfamily II)
MARQVVPGVYAFTGLVTGRVYLIVDDDGLTVIDAGLALAPPRIIRQLEALGYEAGDVQRILITHAHPDHVGGLPELQRLTGAEVITSEVEKPIVEGEAVAPRPPKESLSGLARLMHIPSRPLPGTPVGRAVVDGDRLAEVFGGLEVVATPGHSPGHVAFWQAERRLLFCGDVMMHLFARLSLPFRAATPDMDENIRSISRVAALEPAVICFGHGPPLMEGAAEAVKRFARRVGAIE